VKISKLLITTFLCSQLFPLAANAQIPPDGTVPLSSASMNVTQSGQYSTTAPFANLNVAVTINHGNAFAPYDEEYLEISAPSSAPIYVDIATACTRMANRMLDCFFQYPLSTTDMLANNITVSARYYVKKNWPPYEGYYKNGTLVSGQAGSTGNAGSSGSGSVTLPTLTQIPPHGYVIADHSYRIEITPTPSQYSTSSPTLRVDFTIEPQGVGHLAPPFANELIELKSDTGAVVSVSPQSDCTRYGAGNRSLNCTKFYTMPASDLSEPVRQLQVRYYADGTISNSQISWVGYSAGWKIITKSTSGGGTPTAGNCDPETQPMMPTSSNTTTGTFTFTIPSSGVCAGEFWIDPPVAAGYDYTISGAHFEKVKMPGLLSVPDTDGYTVAYPFNNMLPSVSLQAGEEFTFPVPVNSLKITGINPQLSLDPADQMAFPAGIDVTTPTGSNVTITQTPITVMYPPASTNNAPVAKAGGYINAVGQTSFNLNAGGSHDPDNDPLSYAWIQITGPAVTIPSTTSLAPNIAVPSSGPTPEFIVFELKVNDGTENSAPDQVVVQVR